MKKTISLLLALLLALGIMNAIAEGAKTENDPLSLCESFGWIPISMRDDWTTIYGDGVTKK